MASAPNTAPESPTPTPSGLERFRAKPEALMTTPTRLLIRKPRDGEMVQFHPDKVNPLVANLLEVGRDSYLITPQLAEQLKDKLEVRTYHLYVGTGSDERKFLWAIPAGRGKNQSWSASALRTAEAGRGKWIHVKSGYGRYTASAATGDRPQSWDGVSVETVIMNAFEGRIIDDINHDVLRELRGEV